MVKANFNNAAGRIAAITGAFTLFFCFAITSIMPAISSADALNPLTARTLLLTSSSPGWAYTDGAGDSTFAPPGSGANGQKTGETFTFNTSTNSLATSTPLKAFTLQYCTSAAGLCGSPGNDWEETTPGSPPYTDDATHSDLDVVGSWTEGTGPGQFQVSMNSGSGFTATSGWTMSTSNVEDSGATHVTDRNNLITLLNSTGISPVNDEPIKIQFFPSSSAYITNPGAGAFFVKINDYNNTNFQNWDVNEPNDDVCNPAGDTVGTGSGFTSTCPSDVIDGGVTVANVMNQSIEIQTKVLETMDFSVGTFDPDTVTDGGTHGSCDPIQSWNGTASDTVPAADTLLLGDPTAEDSLSPQAAYGTSSLWRLSTNSANGATVYYTGNTLADTEGNQITPITTEQAALPGSEQFGLGLNYNTETDPNNPDATGTSMLVPYSIASDFITQIENMHTSDNQNKAYWYTPTLSPLIPEAGYGDAIGAPTGVFTTAQDAGGPGTPPEFDFSNTANTSPVPIASEDTDVVDCSTGQVNYVADIAASTPADTYTTKINYLAAPEY